MLFKLKAHKKDNLLNSELNPLEEKRRKAWLLSTLANFIYYPIAYGIIVLILTEEKQFNLAFTPLFISAFSGLILLCSFYYCAYKKRGTKLLLLALIISPFNYLSYVYTTILAYKDLGSLFSVVSETVFYSWWYYQCYQLRIVNKTHRIQIVKKKEKEDQEYREQINQLRISTTLDELERNFALLNNRWPEHKAVSSREYKAKKTAFSMEA
jgi:Zn-dependent protease with chaperone function